MRGLFRWTERKKNMERRSKFEIGTLSQTNRSRIAIVQMCRENKRFFKVWGTSADHPQVLNGDQEIFSRKYVADVCNSRKACVDYLLPAERSA